jgi:hypothetical protein
VGHGQIKINERAQGLLRVGIAESLQEAAIALVEHIGDRLGDQVILGFEMQIEAAMGEFGARHHIGKRNAADTLLADRRGGDLQDPLPRALSVLTVVSHTSS